MSFGNRSAFLMGCRTCGTVIPRDAGDKVYPANRVIVHREQARLLQVITEPVGARLAREAVAAVIQPNRRSLWERC
ncbi:hypothetical protein ACTUVN_004004, partial [Pseudomonas caspiana]